MKTTERRLKRIAQRYAKLANIDAKRCKDEWRRNILQPYLDEIRRRSAAADVRCFSFAASTRSDNPAGTNCAKHIFDVYRRAILLLQAGGPLLQRLVGDETEAMLRAECSSGVASLYDARLYRPTQKYKH